MQRVIDITYDSCFIAWVLRISATSLLKKLKMKLIENAPGIYGIEVRPLYFTRAFYNNKIANARIISFGKCNVSCIYCKRGCQFIDEQSNPINTINVGLNDVISIIDDACSKGQVVRFSGGDPCMYKKETLLLAKYVMAKYNNKVSIAHNGTSSELVTSLLPYLSSAAIDLKAVPEKIGYIMGMPSSRGEHLYASSLKTQSLISNSEVLLDVRTPIFGDTTLTELLNMATDIVSNNNTKFTFWTWRLYKPVAYCLLSTPIKEDVLEMMKIVSMAFPNLWLGMRAKWHKGGMIYMRNAKAIPL